MRALFAIFVLICASASVGRASEPTKLSPIVLHAPIEARQVEKKAKWLAKHPLTSPLGKPEYWPKPKETCTAKNIRLSTPPRLALPPTVRAALDARGKVPWSFVRYDVDLSIGVKNVAAIDSSGDPDFDAAAVVAVEAAGFLLLNGTDLAVGCIAYFNANGYVGVSPVPQRGHKKKKRPRAPQSYEPTPPLSQTPSDSQPSDKIAPIEKSYHSPPPPLPVMREKTGTNRKTWTPPRNGDRAGQEGRKGLFKDYFEPGLFPCTTLAEQLARPAQCNR